MSRFRKMVVAVSVSVVLPFVLLSAWAVSALFLHRGSPVNWDVFVLWIESNVLIALSMGVGFLLSFPLILVGPHGKVSRNPWVIALLVGLIGVAGLATQLTQKLADRFIRDLPPEHFGFMNLFVAVSLVAYLTAVGVKACDWVVWRLRHRS